MVAIFRLIILALLTHSGQPLWCNIAYCSTQFSDDGCVYKPMECPTDKSHSCVTYSFWDDDRDTAEPDAAALHVGGEHEAFGVAFGSCIGNMTSADADDLVCPELLAQHTKTHGGRPKRWWCDECRSNNCNAKEEPPPAAVADFCNQATCINTGGPNTCIYNETPCNNTYGTRYNYCMTYSYKVSFWGVVVGYAGGLCMPGPSCESMSAADLARISSTGQDLPDKKNMEDWTCEECPNNNCNNQTLPPTGRSRSCNMANCNSREVGSSCIYEASPCPVFQESCVSYSYSVGSGQNRISYAKGECALSSEPACNALRSSIANGAVREWDCEQCTTDDCNSPLQPPRGVLATSQATRVSALRYVALLLHVAASLLASFPGHRLPRGC